MTDSAPAPTAGSDLVIADARILTPHGVIDGDIVIAGGLIRTVGAGVRRDAPGGIPELDARGGLISPGFQDAHAHPFHAGLDLLRCDLSGEITLAGYRHRIQEFAAGHPDAEWIQGGGWSMESFPGGVPTAAMLDAIVPERPAFLPNRDGHGAWVNSRALAVAGITRDTPDPADGRIERDADGEPVGMLQEGAMELITPYLPEISDDLLDKALIVAQRRMLGWGVTAWQDAMVGAVHGMPDILESYLRVADRGDLIATVVGALWWDRLRGPEQLPELIEKRRRAAGRERFRATSVKIMQDGVAETRTAAMLENYLDCDGHDSGATGTSFLDPHLLRDVAVACDAAGFQLHFHALGDRAVRECLDAIAAARTANGVRDARHHLAHLQVVHPADIPRFAALDAIANVQPLWACHEPQMDELTIPLLGDRRARWQYPFGALARAGARLAFGSDWPVSSADPLPIIHTAVTRTGIDGDPARPLGGEQGISLADAFHAATAGSAWVNHDERRAGTIAPGLAGDLVLLDRDPFDHPIAEFPATRLVATVVDGAVVHES